MGRAAIVRGGVVENVILADAGFDPGNGYALVRLGDEPVSIGDLFDGKRFSSVEREPEPEFAEQSATVSEKQLCSALEQVGLTEEQAKSLIQFAQTLSGDPA